MAVRLGRWLVLPAVFAVAGCGDSGTIRVLDETAPTSPASPTIPDAQKQYRILAAMIPVELANSDDPDARPMWWFIKGSGPVADIAKCEADFDKLLDTIHASTDETNPITWELPKGWTQGGSEKRGSMVEIFATLKPPGGEIEFTVTRSGASVLANAQRWWGQLWGKDKQQDLTVAMLPDYVRQRSVKGRLILRIDMAGPNDPKKSGPMMKNPHGGM
jgi:hypothetical protein